jgi:hypothetical protein
MYKEKTRKEYIHDFAKVAHKVFIQNNWTWSNEFSVGVPSHQAIENMVKYLAEDIDKTDESIIRNCGRITIISSDNEIGFELSLNLTTHYNLL